MLLFFLKQKTKALSVIVLFTYMSQCYQVDVGDILSCNIVLPNWLLYNNT